MITPETFVPPSGSRLQIAETCPASMVLPRTEEASGEAAEIGTAIHAFIEGVSSLLATSGLEDARDSVLSRVPESIRSRCENLNLEALDLRPDSLHEVGFVLNPTSGDVRFVGVGLKHGDFQGGPGEIPIVLDRVTDRPDLDRVDVDDWKTGFLPVPVKGNLQLLTGAVCAARHFGRSAARVRIVKLPEDGQPRVDFDDLDLFDLDSGMLRLLAIVDSGREQARRLVAGESLKYVQNGGCRYCRSFNHCAEAMRAIVVMARGPLNVESEITGLIATGTDEDASKAALAFERWNAVAKRIQIAILTRARNRPIPFPDGTVLGLRAATKTKLDGEKVFAEMSAAHGAEVAALCVTKKATKKGVRNAAKVVAEKRTTAQQAENPKAKKVTIVAAEADLHAFLKAQGAIATETKTKLDRHKPGEVVAEEEDE